MSKARLQRCWQMPDRMRAVAWCLAFLALALAPAPGVASTQTASQAAAAFDTMKSLQGKWTITRDGKPRPTVMTYDIGSRGSIVTEQFGHELSVFYLDGNRLLMTHFCNAGNQPRLQLRAAAKPGALDFVMFDITGLHDPKAAHVQEAIYQTIDAGTVRLSLVWTGEGTGAPEVYTLSRGR